MTAPLTPAALAHIQAARDGRLDIRSPKGLLVAVAVAAKERGISTSAYVVEALARAVS